MRAPASLFIGLSVALIGSVSLPAIADAAQSRRAPARRAAPRHLDLSAHGPSVAIRAAQAAQAAALPGAAKPAEAPDSADTVAGLTVSPEARRQGKVVASTDATSLTSPNFSVADAAAKPLAVEIAPKTALGKQKVDNTPAPAGLLHNNPELLGSQPVRGDVGVTSVF